MFSTPESSVYTVLSWSCTLWSHGLGLGVGLAGLLLCCETRSCHARCHNNIEGHINFSSTIYSSSILVLEHHKRRNQQWRSLKAVKSAKCLRLLPAVLVLIMLFWSWSWSQEFALIYVAVAVTSDCLCKRCFQLYLTFRSTH